MTLKESLCEIVGIVNAMVDAEPWKEPNKATLETALRLYEAIPQPWEETIGEKAADGFYKRGNVYFKLNDFEKSIASFDKAIELDPNDAVAYNNRGGTKRELGQYEQAIADFDKAIELNPNYAVAYLNRGYTKRKLERFDEALLDFNKAIIDFSRTIELNPDDAVTYQYRGFAKIELKQYEQAIPDLDKAIELNPHIAAYCHRGFAKKELKQFEQAIADFDKVIELNPNHIAAYYHRGFARIQLGLYEAAIDDYDMMIGVDPDEYAFHNRAFSKFKIGKTDDAIVDLKCALQIAGDFLPSYAVLGDCYRALGKNSDAETAYTKALELTTPENLTQNYRPPIRAERGLKALGREVTTNYTQLAIEKGLITEKEIEVL